MGPDAEGSLGASPESATSHRPVLDSRGSAGRKPGADEGRLRAVLNCGGLAIADPAVDWAAARSLLSGPARRDFADVLRTDPGERARGREWAILLGLLVWPDSIGHDPARAQAAEVTLRRALWED